MEVKIKDTWTRVEGQKEVEQAIMKNNTLRFHLASSTPMMMQQMTNKFGYLADTTAAQSIIEGKYEYDPQIDHHTNLFLQYILRIRSSSFRTRHAF